MCPYTQLVAVRFATYRIRNLVQQYKSYSAENAIKNSFCTCQKLQRAFQPSQNSDEARL